MVRITSPSSIVSYAAQLLLIRLRKRQLSLSWTCSRKAFARTTPDPGQFGRCWTGVFKEILELHKQGGLGDRSGVHTSNQEAFTGWVRPKINDTKTPNWFSIHLLYNKFNLAGIFILKLQICTAFSEIYCPFANCTFYWVELHKRLQNCTSV